MISGRGKGAAYIPAKATDIRGLDPLALADRFKKNQEDALAREDLEKQRKAKKDRDFEDSFDLADDDFVAKVSTIKQVDDANRHAANIGYDKYLELERNAIDAQKKGDTKRARFLRDRAYKIKNSFKGANQIAETMLGQVENYRENLKGGLVSKYDEETAMLAEAYGKKNFLPELDENDNWFLKVLGEDDKGNKYQLPDVPMDKLAISLQGKPSYNVDEFVKNHIDNAGYIKSKRADGTPYYTTTKSVDPKKKAAIKADIASLSVKESPTFFHIFAEANGGNPKYKGFTKADEEKVEKYLINQFEGVFDDENLKSKNDVKDAQNNRALKRKELNQKEDKAAIIPVKDIDGNSIAVENPIFSASDLPKSIYEQPFIVKDSFDKKRQVSRGVFAESTNRVITDIVLKTPSNGKLPEVVVSYRTNEKGAEPNSGVNFNESENNVEKLSTATLNNRQITALRANLQEMDGVEATSLVNILSIYTNRDNNNDSVQETSKENQYGI